MKIKIVQSIAGNPDARYGLLVAWSFAPGEVVTLHKDLAKAWIDAGIAAAAEKEK